MTSTPESTRRDLIAMRVKYGADSPIGHRCSNLVEMLQNYEDAEPVRRKRLAENIQKQMAELAKQEDDDGGLR